MANTSDENRPQGENVISDSSNSQRRLASEPVPDPEEIERQSERQAKIAALPNRSLDPKKTILFVALAIGGALLLFTAIDAMRGDGQLAETEVVETRDGPLADYDPSAVIAPTLDGAPNDPNAPIDLAQVPELDGTTSPAGPQTRPQKSEAQIIAEAQRRSSIMAYGGEGNTSDLASVLDARSSTPEPGRSTPPDGSASPPNSGGTQLERLRQTSSIDRVAGRTVGDRNMMILAGTFIPCVLQTAMDSSQPGYVSCIVPRDIYSDNGRVVLLERGTRILGEYQGGISRGRYRLFVVWNRAVTPRGIAVDVGSPASDSLGRAGMPGAIDNFFWERFGAALLFSAVDGATAVASAEVSDADILTRAPNQTADTILRDQSQIQPVLKKNQGEEVGVMVARDFDFSDVYNLRLRP